MNSSLFLLEIQMRNFVDLFEFISLDGKNDRFGYHSISSEF